MGYILKQGYTYPSPEYGDNDPQPRTEAYAAISIGIIEFYKKQVNVGIAIYPTRELAVQGLGAIKTEFKICENWIEELEDGTTIEHNDWDIYFAPLVIAQGNIKQFAYDFWVNGGVSPSVGTFIFENWQSDEV